MEGGEWERVHEATCRRVIPLVEPTEARAAFFPLYPWLARTVDVILPGGDTFAVLAVNFVLGGVAVVLVGLLARRTYSVSVAAKSMTLFAIFPGSFVLSFAYSEALLIVLAAACLLFLLAERCGRSFKGVG